MIITYPELSCLLLRRGRSLLCNLALCVGCSNQIIFAFILRIQCFYLINQLITVELLHRSIKLMKRDPHQSRVRVFLNALDLFLKFASPLGRMFMPMLTSCLPELFLGLKAACKKVHVCKFACKTTSRAEFHQTRSDTTPVDMMSPWWWRSGRAFAFQLEGRGFESRLGAVDGTRLIHLMTNLSPTSSLPLDTLLPGGMDNGRCRHEGFGRDRQANAGGHS